MFHDKCGVMGVWNHPSAGHLVYAGLYAIQHRGQESAGITTWTGSNLVTRKGMGKVMDIFSQEDLSTHLQGDCAIGHTRYSTEGASEVKNAQPLVMELPYGEVGIAHNGQITNAVVLKENLKKEGTVFQTSSDTEIILHLLAKQYPLPLEKALIEIMDILEGAYSLVLLYKDRVFGVRDPFGFRPLCLGKKEDGFVLASETCALDLLEADFMRELKPGEVLALEAGGPRTLQCLNLPQSKFCVFELIYFSRPDSLFQNKDILSIRMALGKQLAREAPAPNADMVIGIPDSSNPAAIGYAKESGLPFELGLIRNHYIGRTFIEPHQSIRLWRGRIKYNPVARLIHGKSLVVVDDSIVRGNTCKRLMTLLKESGAREIHLRISSPIIFNPCYYGIDTPSHEELIGHQLQKEKAIQEYFGADSLHYLSLEGLKKAVFESAGLESFCDACFTGNYPTPIYSEVVKKDFHNES